MSERGIGTYAIITDSIGRKHHVYEPDPEAPSVSEVVEVLKEAGCRDCDGSGWLPVRNNGQSIKCEWCRNRGNLIARLEG